MVGAGRERSEAPTSARGGRGSSIPPHILRRALYLSMQTPSAVASSSAGRGRGGRRLVEVDVAAGEVGRLLLRLPRRHPQLIHPTTGLHRLRWSHLRWTRLGLRSMSLGQTSLRPTRLRSQSLRPTRLHSQSLCPMRLRRPLAMLMVARIAFRMIAIARAS